MSKDMREKVIKGCNVSNLAFRDMMGMMTTQDFKNYHCSAGGIQ